MFVVAIALECVEGHHSENYSHEFLECGDLASTLLQVQVSDTGVDRAAIDVSR